MIKKIKNKIPHNLLGLFEISRLFALCLTLIIGIIATFLSDEKLALIPPPLLRWHKGE